MSAYGILAYMRDIRTPFKRFRFRIIDLEKSDKYIVVIGNRTCIDVQDTNRSCLKLKLFSKHDITQETV